MFHYYKMISLYFKVSADGPVSRWMLLRLSLRREVRLQDHIVDFTTVNKLWFKSIPYSMF